MASPVENLLSPLRPHLNNKEAIEIVCNSPGKIAVERRNGRWDEHAIPELSESWWNSLANGLAIMTGQRFSTDKPIMRGTLPGGHRLFLMTGPNVIDPATGSTGVCATIRLKRKFAMDFSAFGVDMNAEKLIKNAVATKKNILVAGSMGSGKTSLTQILCDLIRDGRPVSIEDSSEIVLTQPQATQFLVSAVESDTDITNKDVVSNLQRSRADRFIIGEITMENVVILMRLYNLGVPGTIGTIHADFASEVVESIAELLNLSGYAKDEESTKRYFERKIDMVIFVERAGPSRVISEILKPVPGEQGDILWRRG